MLDDCTVELRAAASADGGSDVSILQEALQAGYSSDGELFDIHHLCDLAARCCALDAAVVSLASTAGAWEERLPSWLRAVWTWMKTAFFVAAGPQQQQVLASSDA